MKSCNDNYVTNFVAYGTDRHDAKYCFDFLAKEPKELRSSGSQMTLIFNSIIADQYTPSTCQASYTFYTGSLEHFNILVKLQTTFNFWCICCA